MKDDTVVLPAVKVEDGPIWQAITKDAVAVAESPRKNLADVGLAKIMISYSKDGFFSQGAIVTPEGLDRILALILDEDIR